MVGGGYLVETSILTRFAVPVVRAALDRYVDDRPLFRCTLTDLEIGFSASNEREWDLLHEQLSRLTPVDVTPAVVARARTVQRMLAAAGLRGRKVPDLVIAAAAELAELTTLHYDSDFDLIAHATGQSAEWLLPRGSIN